MSHGKSTSLRIGLGIGLLAGAGGLFYALAKMRRPRLPRALPAVADDRQTDMPFPSALTTDETADAARPDAENRT